jgi:spermidine synthase
MLSLRRRRRSADDVDIYEIKLDDGYLMSSLFTAGEIALADRGLAELGGRDLDVVVGGLGLGYTAMAALARRNVRTLMVVEAIPEVIEWHQRHLLPLGEALTNDPRCRLVCGNFFELAAPGGSFEPEHPSRQYDAILVDIDHSPRHVLHPANAAFYKVAGLLALADKLVPDGVFALWSTDPPDEEFLSRLRAVFATATADIVLFDNPYQSAVALNTIYVARKNAPSRPAAEVADGR